MLLPNSDWITPYKLTRKTRSPHPTPAFGRNNLQMYIRLQDQLHVTVEHECVVLSTL